LEDERSNTNVQQKIREETEVRLFTVEAFYQKVGQFRSAVPVPPPLQKNKKNKKKSPPFSWELATACQMRRSLPNIEMLDLKIAHHHHFPRSCAENGRCSRTIEKYILDLWKTDLLSHGNLGARRKFCSKSPRYHSICTCRPNVSDPSAVRCPGDICTSLIGWELGELMHWYMVRGLVEGVEYAWTARQRCS
jgi:hypothetical protein